MWIPDRSDTPALLPKLLLHCDEVRVRVRARARARVRVRVRVRVDR